MALQAIEITENGLGNSEPLATAVDQVVKGLVSPRLSARRLNQAKAAEKSCAKEHLSR
jgi:hypothetical protein